MTESNIEKCSLAGILHGCTNGCNYFNKILNSPMADDRSVLFDVGGRDLI